MRRAALKKSLIERRLRVSILQFCLHLQKKVILSQLLGIEKELCNIFKFFPGTGHNCMEESLLLRSHSVRPAVSISHDHVIEARSSNLVVSSHTIFINVYISLVLSTWTKTQRP